MDPKKYYEETPLLKKVVLNSTEQRKQYLVYHLSNYFVHNVLTVVSVVQKLKLQKICVARNSLKRVQDF